VVEYRNNMKKIGKIWDNWLNINYAFIVHAPVFISAIIGFAYCYMVLINIKSDTTKITNAAFIILATMATLSFAFSRAISKTSKLAEKILYSGERFFHAAIHTLVASIIKYIILIIEPINSPAGNGFEYAVTLLLGIAAFLSFLYAILSAHTGLIILNKILWKRISRDTEWDNFF
jgi:hypothetical protein